MAVKNEQVKLKALSGGLSQGAIALLVGSALAPFARNIKPPKPEHLEEMERKNREFVADNRAGKHAFSDGFPDNFDLEDGELTCHK